ncbi:hypothetical protein N8843_09945 [Verrucomicrobia bacterium]|nr:hypothetical protein [Verrucomicrobiota bacterium]
MIANAPDADFVSKSDRVIGVDPVEELPSVRSVKLRQYPIQVQSYWHHRFKAFRRLPRMEGVPIETPSNWRCGRPAPALRPGHIGSGHSQSCRLLLLMIDNGA